MTRLPWDGWDLSTLSIVSSWLWLQTVGIPQNSTPRRNAQASSDSKGMSVDLPETTGGRSVGLWTEDGYRDTVLLSRFIQATLHTSQPLIDPLDVDLKMLKQQMREYERREP